MERAGLPIINDFDSMEDRYVHIWVDQRISAAMVAVRVLAPKRRCLLLRSLSSLELTSAHMQASGTYKLNEVECA